MRGPFRRRGSSKNACIETKKEITLESMCMIEADVASIRRLILQEPLEKCTNIFWRFPSKWWKTGEFFFFFAPVLDRYQRVASRSFTSLWISPLSFPGSSVLRKSLGKKTEIWLMWEPCHSKIIQSLHGAALKPEIRGGLKVHGIGHQRHSLQTFYKPRWWDGVGLSKD